MSTESADKPIAPKSSYGDRPKPAGATGGYSSRPPMGAGAPGAGGGYKGRAPMGVQSGMGRGRPPIRRRVCRICMDRQGGVDWKAANFLRNFITERGKILSGRSTGTCARCQRQLTEAIKRARNIALIPTSPI